jgi:hypothetical protein
MKQLVLLTILTLAVAGWAQSLGDVARASREHPKQSAKVVTNEDLKSEPSEKQPDVSGDLGQDLDHMRTVLHQICSDPRTNHGRTLSDFDKKQIEEGATPLRARVSHYESIQKHYKDALAELDSDVEARIQKTLPTGRPYTAEDVEQANLIRRDYESRKALLVKKGETDLQGFKALQQQLESVGQECSDAAKMVPD